MSEPRSRWHSGRVNNTQVATLLGGAVVAIVVFAHAAGSVGWGSADAPLTLAVASMVYVGAAVTFLVWRSTPPRLATVLLLVVAGASIALRLADPTGPVVGLFFVMAFAPLRLPSRWAVAVAVLSALGFNTAQALTADNPIVFILVTDMGAVFFFALGTLLVREQRQRERADRLVVELEAARASERRAVAVAERSRIAREMHDVLAHTLSGLSLHLEAARLLAKQGGVTPQLQSSLDQAHALTKEGLDEAQRAIHALRGEQLPGPADLSRLVDEHRRANGGRCVFRVNGEAHGLSPEAGVTLYRTAQEALTNVRKHAPGADVDVQLEWSPTRAVLTVHDHAGNGANNAAPGGGYGLTGMAERANLLGGDVQSGPVGDGFRVRLCLPLEPAT